MIDTEEVKEGLVLEETEMELVGVTLGTTVKPEGSVINKGLPARSSMATVQFRGP